MKDKNVTTITNTFQSILGNSNCKSNKIRIEKGGKFYNRSMKSWLEDNDVIEMYSALNQRKSIVAERFIRTLKKQNLQIHDFIIKK